MTSMQTSILFAVVAILHVSPLQAAGIDVIAQYGQASAGIETDARFFEIGYPAINEAGDVAFSASLTRSAFAPDVWAYRGGVLELIAPFGMISPRVSDDRITSLSGEPFIGDDGRVTFRVGQFSFQGILEDTAAGLAVLLAEGDFIPNVSGKTVRAVHFLAVNRGGGVAAIVQVNDGGSKWFWTTQDGEQRTFPSGSRRLPPLEGATLVSFGQQAFGQPVISDEGLILFEAFLSGEQLALLRTDDQVIVSLDDQGLRLVVREGDPASGADDGLYFGQGQFSLSPKLQRYSQFSDPFGSLCVNNAGQIAFLATLERENDTPTTIDDSSARLLDGQAIVMGTPGDVRIAFRTGDQVPGEPEGVVFDRFFTVLLSGNGELVFGAQVSGLTIRNPDLPNYDGDGIWTGTPSNLRRVAQDGKAVSGIEGAIYSGVTISSGVLGTSTNYAINESGQVAFLAQMMLDKPTTAIWIYDHGDLQLLIRQGDSVETEDGDSREIENLRFLGGSGNQDGRRSGFSDSGSLAASLFFKPIPPFRREGGIAIIDTQVFIDNAPSQPAPSEQPDPNASADGNIDGIEQPNDSAGDDENSGEVDQPLDADASQPVPAPCGAGSMGAIILLSGVFFAQHRSRRTK